LRAAVLVVAVLAVFAVSDLIDQLVRKPSELLFPVSSALDKPPSETWRQYGALFREYATASIPPELLAALAQVEASGNPIARTYWRWRPSWDLFAIYQPASSAVGMYQMTDAAFAEARRFCIRGHKVIAAGGRTDWHSCWFTDLYTRLLPSHAIQLTAILLDRKVAAILPRRPKAPATPQQVQDLAVVVHLCGATPAKAFAQRAFRPAPGERCGDHDLALYLARVNAMKKEFVHLAARQE
jgi:hypothetical protein